MNTKEFINALLNQKACGVTAEEFVTALRTADGDTVMELVESLQSGNLRVQTEILDDDSLARMISELGNQIHNLGCEHQDSEKLSARLEELALQAWELADSAPKTAPNTDHPEDVLGMVMDILTRVYDHDTQIDDGAFDIIDLFPAPNSDHVAHDRNMVERDADYLLTGKEGEK